MLRAAMMRTSGAKAYYFGDPFGTTEVVPSRSERLSRKAFLPAAQFKPAFAPRGLRAGVACGPHDEAEHIAERIQPELFQCNRIAHHAPSDHPGLDHAV